MNIPELNEKYREEFYQNPNENALGKYFMTELLPPIADYENAMVLVRDNRKCLKGLTLLYLAAELCNSWPLMENVFIQELPTMLPSSDAETKSIIYYLISDYISWTYGRSDTRVKQYLELSLQYSGSMKFVNNRKYLASYLHGKDRFNLLSDAVANIECIYSDDDPLPIDYLIDPEREFKEVILGTYISRRNYESLIALIKKEK